MKPRLNIIKSPILAIALFKATVGMLGEDSTNEESATIYLQPYTVIGSQENLLTLPGSGYFMDEDMLQAHGYLDISQALKQVPGVYLRMEDGYGLFPNISLRGVDPGRMSKLTYMEDGVLAAPAAYSAPAAYYTPTMGRMSALEVLKGSSQIQYGPHTTGGVINYISTPIPYRQSSYLNLSYGTDNETRLHFWTGDRLEGDLGEFGYLLEIFKRENDGFKTLESVGDFDGSGQDTGIDNLDTMLKLSWSPNAERKQYFELKTGYTDKDANETYLGLSSNDFRGNPYRRYAASRDDNIDTQHFRNYLRHTIEFDSRSKLSSTLYYNAFDRNWFKLKEIKDIDLDGDGIIDDSPTVKLYQALAGIDGGRSLEVLRGERAGQYEYRNNSRSYLSRGFQTKLDTRFDLGKSRHDLAIGMRFHSDRIRRFQEDVQYFQDDKANIANRIADGPGSGGNRIQKTEAIALFAEDAIRMGQWTLTPGLRYERIDYFYTDYASDASNTPVGSGSRSIDVFAPGIGFNCQTSEDMTLFAGAYRGFSVPGPRSASRSGRELNEETSFSFESGIRYDNRAGIYAEAVVFNIDFDDLITIDNIATGTSNPQNIGSARTHGLELILGWNAAPSKNRSFKAPIALSATYTDAVFKSNSTDRNAESIFAGARIGNSFPYVPEWQFNLSADLEFEAFSFSTNINYADQTFGSGSNATLERDPSGNPDARFGRIDSLFIMDFSLRRKISDSTEIFANLTNAFDEVGLAGRLTDGPRPNAPRQLHVGASMKF